MRTVLKVFTMEKKKEHKLTVFIAPKNNCPVVAGVYVQRLGCVLNTEKHFLGYVLKLDCWHGNIPSSFH